MCFLEVVFAVEAVSVLRPLLGELLLKCNVFACILMLSQKLVVIGTTGCAGRTSM